MPPESGRLVRLSMCYGIEPCDIDRVIFTAYDFFEEGDKYV